MAATVEALMGEVTKLKTKENQTTGFLHTLSILKHSVQSNTIPAEMETEMKALMEEMAKLKTKENQITGFLHTYVYFNTFC